MLLGTRPEEQDVGPKATDIMSGVFEVFVNLTQIHSGSVLCKHSLPSAAAVGVSPPKSGYVGERRHGLFCWGLFQCVVKLIECEGVGVEDYVAHRLESLIWCA